MYKNMQNAQKIQKYTYIYIYKIHKNIQQYTKIYKNILRIYYKYTKITQNIYKNIQYTKNT